ncbi:hypothetical protein DCE79_12925 [Lysinibacillus sp. 2017]|uniref:hypothetical protein n=1 Tax=unclassified Lysinibacillus TaxID=2636778 RepID=UPI000D528EBA|nr:MULTISPECIES: hypothetical protein [unclassified Lysinibacillus]AWE08242.1 hypothetical protein DCE79_12925 [Lysinibacillus sp. 2017]TGN36255.1 hypothetical protein E4L99_05020 [Lysinibacillus sp. S2017]
MKKYILLMLFSFTLILSACTQAEEDTQEYSGIISDEQSFGYEYTVLKEQNNFSWKVGYKGDISIIEESTANQDDLVNYMNAVNDSKLVSVKLITSVSYLLIIIITTLILYKKNRKMLKDSAIVITMLAGIALYIAFKASFDLSSLLQDVKSYYLILTN